MYLICHHLKPLSNVLFGNLIPATCSLFGTDVWYLRYILPEAFLVYPQNSINQTDGLWPVSNVSWCFGPLYSLCVSAFTPTPESFKLSCCDLVNIGPSLQMRVYYERVKGTALSMWGNWRHLVPGKDLNYLECSLLEKGKITWMYGFFYLFCLISIVFK